jgi:phosphatidylglycerophosphate synthase
MVRTGVVIGVITQLTALAVLAGHVGLSLVGWLVGAAVGVFTASALARALVDSGASSLGPANRVTLTRALLVGGVAALVANSFVGPTSTTAVAELATIALILDAVDGRVARRTGTVSLIGARFDMEVDAFLILVLSVCVARTDGSWVLLIGAARYAFVAAGQLLPWLRAPAPPRYWCKTVAAIQGIVLTFAATAIVARPVLQALLVAALALLAESFGRQVWWLWRHRARSRLSVEPVGVSMAGAG